MTKFESSLGTKEVDSGSFRRFSVPDESQSLPPESYGRQAPPETPDMNQLEREKIKKLRELENQVAEARKAKIEDRISPEAKRRVEILSGIGRASVDITIGDHTFTLRTLTAYEQRELALIGFDLAQNQRGDIQFEIRSQILSRALAAVDGQDFSAIVGSDDSDVRMMGLEQLDEVVLRLLMQEYQKLSEENNKKFGIKTEEDLEEVVEDIKKA